MSRLPENLSCVETLEHIEAFIDEDLECEQAAAMANHLSQCNACRQELEFAKKIVSGLHTLPDLRAPASIIENVRQHRRRSWFHVFFGPLFLANRRPALGVAAAMAVILIAVSAGLWRQQFVTPPIDPAVEQATSEVRLALAYVGKASQHAANDLRNELFRDRVVAPTLRSLSHSFEYAVPMVPSSDIEPVRTPETRS
ncbi:MAG: hypothetical protein GY906_38190 [bacterium]|nr:hypothetical protein [bacterium]